MLEEYFEFDESTRKGARNGSERPPSGPLVVVVGFSRVRRYNASFLSYVQDGTPCL